MKTVTIMPEKLNIPVEEGASLLQAAAMADIDIDGSCGGRGVCGKCRVRVDDGGGPREVLACTYKVTTDVTVWPEKRNDHTHRKSQVRLPEWFTPDRKLAERHRRSGRPLGAAVDIGTTTMVIMLLDIAEGKLLGVKSANNPQGVYGADVISRITFADEDPQNIIILRDKAVGCINDALSGLLAEAGRRSEEIGRFAVVGNTTMSHLFTGTDPRSLAVLPFEPVFTEGRSFAAGDIGLKPAEAQVNLLPNIAGHVGSDITAGMLTCDFLKDGGPNLYVDIGTNGEIGLFCGGELTVCSTAAGPAFEGSRISCGMRAGTGAIEKAVLTEEGMDITVIGGSEPTGICGSGIIDVVYELIRGGYINEKGRLISEGEGRERFFTIWHGREGRRDIAVTQNDIREIQLAKGAIAAGIEILLARAGITARDLKAIYIAGAFGSYIDLKKAMGIGLIPETDPDVPRSIGNAAGTGACMGLLSDSFLQEAGNVRKNARHVELSTDPGFMQTYSACMRFKAITDI